MSFDRYIQYINLRYKRVFISQIALQNHSRLFVIFLILTKYTCEFPHPKLSHKLSL